MTFIFFLWDSIELIFEQISEKLCPKCKYWHSHNESANIKNDKETAADNSAAVGDERWFSWPDSFSAVPEAARP
ncbi:MAG: hypothetical protein RR606_07685, partial [Oscillospiraceae bacterium]